MARKPKASVEQVQAKVKERTEAALGGFVSMIESGQFPAQIGHIAMLSLRQDIPAAKWSAGNQLIMLQHGETADARGFRQWQDAGRQVQKGAKAIWIFRPNTRTITAENEKTGEEEKRSIITGFGMLPVFRAEDTDGDTPLPDYAPPQPLPLADVAAALGVSVRYIPYGGQPYLGFYRDATREIVLCTHSNRTFFHELAHAAHYQTRQLTPAESADKQRIEVVAETAAAALCSIYGYGGYELTSAQYVARFAQSANDAAKTIRAIMRYAAEIRDVLTLVLTIADGVKGQGEAA